MIIRHFEAALAVQVALTAFIPMLMGTGGNAGSQTSATVIRALSIGDVKLSDVLRVVLKEARVAVLCGCTLAVLNFVKLLVFDRVSVMVSAVVSITMALTVLFAKLAGAALPMLAKKLGFDPAVVASPFLTTIVDTMSLLIYFLMAGLLLACEASEPACRCFAAFACGETRCAAKSAAHVCIFSAWRRARVGKTGRNMVKVKGKRENARSSSLPGSHRGERPAKPEKRNPRWRAARCQQLSGPRHGQGLSWCFLRHFLARPHGKENCFCRELARWRRGAAAGNRKRRYARYSFLLSFLY